jgi:hypothetical protein
MADTRAVVGLVLTWQMSESFWLLSQIFSGALDLRGVAVYLFYEANFLALFALFLARRIVDNERRRTANLPIQELLNFDIVKQFVPFLSVGLATGVALVFVYRYQGFAVSMPPTAVILQNLLEIVPEETFIFVFFLPQLLPSYLGVPSFIWAAAYAGAFHYFAKSGDPFQIAFAVLLFSLWYLMYKMGEQTVVVNGRARKKGFAFLGLGAAMSMHFMINVFAASATTVSVVPGASILGPFLVAPLIPLAGCIVTWVKLQDRPGLAWRSRLWGSR